MQKTNGKARKSIATGAAALGLALGSVGVGWAMGPSPTDPASQAEAVDNGAEVQDPQLGGSISAPAGQESMSEADESAMLADLATVTEDQARSAALDAVPGTVDSIELGNENGSVVYEVTLTDTSGASMEVKVDAGDGSVLAQDLATDEVDEADEATTTEEQEATASEDEADGIDHEFDGEEVGNNGDGIAGADDANEAAEATAGA